MDKTHTRDNSWFVKVVRSGARLADGSLPAEQWAENVVAPTLNAFDQGGARAVVAIAFHMKQTPVSGESSPVLGTTSGGMGVHSDTVGVRRLTPLECERLQGFPDNWTEGQSDSARYRQMGNAVAVPVVEWIIERLVEHDQP